MAISISLLNMKGGVGKTTLAVNLAWHLCRRKHQRVLLVDLDPQFNSSQYVMTYDEWQVQQKKGTIADLLINPGKNTMQLKKKSAKKKKISSKLKKSIFRRESNAQGGCLDIIPSELALAAAIKSPTGVEYLLQKACDSLEDEYDYIFIDCAPTDSILTDTAFMASDYVLVPMKPDRFSVLGFSHIQAALESFRDKYPDPHKVQDLGVVFTQVSSGGSDIENECMADVGVQADYVFETTIPVSRTYLKSVHKQLPVFATPYCRQLTAASIKNLSAEIDSRINAIMFGV